MPINSPRKLLFLFAAAEILDVHSPPNHCSPSNRVS